MSPGSRFTLNFLNFAFYALLPMLYMLSIIRFPGISAIAMNLTSSQRLLFQTSNHNIEVNIHIPSGPAAFPFDLDILSDLAVQHSLFI